MTNSTCNQDNRSVTVIADYGRYADITVEGFSGIFRVKLFEGDDLTKYLQEISNAIKDNSELLRSYDEQDFEGRKHLLSSACTSRDYYFGGGWSWYQTKHNMQTDAYCMDRAYAMHTGTRLIPSVWKAYPTSNEGIMILKTVRRHVPYELFSHFPNK